MRGIRYDFHIHSALSPCGDADMTPNNIVNMARVAGLDIIALTDHNSCQNCPALLEAAQRVGLPALAGMELCTREEIHVVCLFPCLCHALDFDRYVYEHLPDIQNKPEIYGEQCIMDADDNIIVTEHKLLLNATDIPIDGLSSFVSGFHGVCFPAHIDKTSYSALSVLGFLTPDMGFTAAEVAYPTRFTPASPLVPEGMRILTNSDAHYLWDIGCKEAYLEERLPDFSSIADYILGSSF